MGSGAFAAALAYLFTILRMKWSEIAERVSSEQKKRPVISSQQTADIEAAAGQYEMLTVESSADISHTVITDRENKDDIDDVAERSDHEHIEPATDVPAVTVA